MTLAFGSGYDDLEARGRAENLHPFNIPFRFLSPNKIKRAPNSVLDSCTPSLMTSSKRHASHVSFYEPGIVEYQIARLCFGWLSACHGTCFSPGVPTNDCFAGVAV
jgi:hypothetical protein